MLWMKTLQLNLQSLWQTKTVMVCVAFSQHHTCCQILEYAGAMKMDGRKRKMDKHGFLFGVFIEMMGERRRKEKKIEYNRRVWVGNEEKMDGKQGQLRGREAWWEWKKKKWKEERKKGGSEKRVCPHSAFTSISSRAVNFLPFHGRQPGPVKRRHCRWEDRPRGAEVSLKDELSLTHTLALFPH